MKTVSKLHIANYRSEEEQNVAIRNFIDNLSDLEEDDDYDSYSSDEGL